MPAAAPKMMEHKIPPARIGPSTEPPSYTGVFPAQIGILHLQRAAGNRAVDRLVQTKRKISAPGDRHEREADAVADQVMRIARPRAISILRCASTRAISPRHARRTCSH